MSVAGKQRIALNIDQSVFPSQELFEKLSEFMTEELQELKKEADLHEKLTRKIENIV